MAEADEVVEVVVVVESPLVKVEVVVVSDPSVAGSVVGSAES